MTDTAGFVNAVHRRLGMRPVLPLDFPIEIGDVGAIGRDGVWQRDTTVRHRFNSFPARVRRTTPDGGVWEVSSDDVSFETFQRGQTSALVPTLAHAKARTEISFRSHRSFVLAARGVTIRTATEIDALIDGIHLAYWTRRERPEEGRWYRNLCFVLAVADAERFTALLPMHDDARLSITPRGTGGPPASPAQLASLVRFGAGSEDFVRTNQRDARGRFYRAYRLRQEILARWRGEPSPTHSRDVLSFEQPTASFEETFVEV